MKATSLALFVLSAAVCTLAATHRFHDSAHSIGMIKADGGRARHPALLDKGRDSYTLIATATVLPPYRGNVRVAVEGSPAMEYNIYPGEPAVDLSPYRHPVFRDNVLYDLQPKDKVALWVVMKPKPGSTAASPAAAVTPPQHDECCDIPDAAPRAVSEPAGRRGNDSAGGAEHRPGEHWGGKPGSTRGREAGQRLAFYDIATGKPVLSVPIVYKNAGTREGEHGVD